MASPKEFEMSEEDLTVLLKAMQPVPYMIIGGVEPRSQQENANAAWEELGKKLGFKHMTVQPPTGGKGMRFFWAEPAEKQA